MFLWITGTGLGWYYYYVFAEALVVILCCCGSVFAACDCFGGFIICVISFVFSLQMFASDDVWSCTPVGVKPNLGEFISTLLKSKADSTSRRYMKEISKFIEFCNSSKVQPVPPFPVSFIVVYLFYSLLLWKCLCSMRLFWRFHNLRYFFCFLVTDVCFRRCLELHPGWCKA